MSNVRNITPEGQFNNREICKVLAHLPCLESLELGRHEILQDYRCSAPMHLPDLYNLVLRHCLIYLRDIVTPAGCSFALTGAQTNGQESYTMFIATMLHNHLSVVPSKSIHLYCHDKLIKISNEAQESLARAGNFDINILSFINEQEGLLEALAFPNFSTITTLKIQCDGFES